MKTLFSRNSFVVRKCKRKFVKVFQRKNNSLVTSFNYEIREICEKQSQNREIISVKAMCQGARFHDSSSNFALNLNCF